MSYGATHTNSPIRMNPNNSASLPVNATVRKTRNNIKAWYFYCFSSEPFVVSAVATYIPLLLESFARINGVRLDNHSRRCTNDTHDCVLGLFGNRIFIDTSSFALYVFSTSVMFQTVVVVSVSGLVDIWKTIQFKRTVLVSFGILGSFATIWIARLQTSQYYMLAVLYIVANSCFGVINVVGNSLLPSFVSDVAKYDNVAYAVEPGNLDALMSLISGRGAGIGYASALLVQICSVSLLFSSKSKQDVQVAVLLVGLWWLVWQLPMMILFSDIDENSTSNTTSNSYANRQAVKFKWSYMRYGWMSLFESFKNASLLKDVMLFLVSWFMISDSVTTINSSAILFSKTELHMSTVDLILVSILTMINAMLGAFVFPQILSKKLSLTADKTLVFIIYWTCFIPFYGILGFVFRDIGLKHKYEMFGLAIWYGLSMGALAAVSRSVFSLIIPKGKESTFFSIYSITDKGSSIVGPFVVGLITDKTHNIRYAFFFLLGLLVFSIPILNLLDVRRGKAEAEQLSRLNVESIRVE